MIKFKILTAALAIMGGASLAFADDVFKEVTSEYLTNADFEGEYSIKSGTGVSSDRAIYQPDAWTVTYTNGQVNDCSALNSDCKQWNFFKSYSKLDTGGNNTYWIRLHKDKKTQNLELSQTIILPLGSYKLSAAYLKAESGGDGYIFANSKKESGTSNNTWITVSVNFTSDGKASTKLGCLAVHTNSYNKIYAFDNFVLEWNLTASLQTLIDAATEIYNEDTSNTTLFSSIQAAEGVIESTDPEVLENAYNDLAEKSALATNRNAWNAARTTAQNTLINEDYSNVTGDERTALEEEINKNEPSSAVDYDTAKTDLETATEAFIAAKKYYDSYVEEITRAIAMKVDGNDIDELTNASDYLTKLHALIVLEDEAVTSRYTVNITETYGDWTKTNIETANNEHWSGNETTYYNKWSNSSFNSSVSKTAPLPAGNYVLKAAARAYNVNNNDNFYMGVTIGETSTKEVYTSVNGKPGKGITTDGTANYDNGIFANDNNGYGWEWRFIKFTLEEATSVSMTLTASLKGNGWVSFSDITLLTTDDNIAYYRQLYDASKESAQAAYGNPTYANLENGSEWKTLKDAVESAVPDNVDAEWYQNQKAAIESAMADFTDPVTVESYDRLAAAFATASAIGETGYATTYEVTDETTASIALSSANEIFADMLKNLLEEKAQGGKLGFKAGEYAPYESAGIIAALANAPAVEDVAETASSVLDESIQNLSLYVWENANSVEVDAIYDGSLANAPIQATSDNVVLPGWVTKSGNTRQTFQGTESKACLGEGEVGLFVHPGTYNYGETLGYTMPLKGGVTYVAQAKYCSWASNSNNNFTLTVKQGSTTVASKSFGANRTACTEADAFKTVRLYFTPESDDDYVLSVSIDGNTFMTGFSILSYDVPELTIAENASTLIESSEYAKVTLARGFNEGWNAVCLPFATPAFDGAEIAEFTGETIDGNNVTLIFKKVDAFEANKPYMVYFPEAVAAGKTFEGVIVAPDEVLKEGTAFDFKGIYTVTDIEAGDWVISGGKLKKASSAISLKPTRTYFTPKAAEARVANFVVDGQETTGMKVAMAQEGMPVDGIYNLKGQKVNGQLKKGIYVVNGKKIVK